MAIPTTKVERIKFFICSKLCLTHKKHDCLEGMDVLRTIHAIQRLLSASQANYVLLNMSMVDSHRSEGVDTRIGTL